MAGTIGWPDGVVSSSQATSFSTFDASVDSITPDNGPVGAGFPVTITGANFLAGAAVAIGGSVCAAVVVVDINTITCTVGAHAAGGPFDVVVTNAGANAGTLAAAYTYYAAPTVTGIAPDNSPVIGGISVVITGTGFLPLGAGPSANIDLIACTNVVWANSTTITAVCGADIAQGPVNVQVVNDDADTQNGIGAGLFNYYDAPTVTLLVPDNDAIAGGGTITITGTGFVNVGGTDPTVNFGVPPAVNVVLVGPATITADTPPHAAATVGVTVTLADFAAQSGTLSNSFQYVPAPTLTTVAPATGGVAGGTPVTLTGTGFLNIGGTDPVVTFDAVPAANIVLVGPTSITCDTPAHLAATVDVVVTLADANAQFATKVNGFTYA